MLPATQAEPPSSTSSGGGAVPASPAGFDALRPALLRFFERRVRVPADAEDLVQEVYMRLAKHGGQDVRDAAAFLFQVAANVLTDKYRRDAARQAADHEPLQDEHPAGEAPSAERVYAGRQSLERVVAALEELTPKCRAIFLLVRYDGLTYSEAAKRFGVGVSAVEKHMMHALQHLHQRLDMD